MLGRNLYPARISTPGCASLYNDQATMQLVPYNDRNDDLLLSRFKDLGPNQAYTTTLPRTSAYPSPIEDSLSIPEFINDTTHHTVTDAIQVLYNAHMDACDLKQTLTIDHHEADLLTFNHTHPYHHESPYGLYPRHSAAVYSDR